MMKYFSAIIVCLGLLMGFDAATESVSASPVQQANLYQHHDVYYQLGNWRSVHFHDHNAAHQFMNSLKNLGCNVHEHGDDVHYICQNEHYVHFNDHNAAHNFLNQMRALGFNAHMH